MKKAFEDYVGQDGDTHDVIKLLITVQKAALLRDRSLVQSRVKELNDTCKAKEEITGKPWLLFHL